MLVIMQDTPGGGPTPPGDPARSDAQLWAGCAVWAPPHLPVPASPPHPVVRLWIPHQNHNCHTEGLPYPCWQYFLVCQGCITDRSKAALHPDIVGFQTAHAHAVLALSAWAVVLRLRVHMQRPLHSDCRIRQLS